MRTAWALLPSIVLTFATTVHAETWNMTLVVNKERSAARCSAAGAYYTMELNGDTLSVSNRHGKMFTITVPSDGNIKQAFKSPSGNRLAITGNVKTKDLEVENYELACHFKMVPAQ